MKEKPNPGASEAGHYYERDGTPCYEVENASKPGEMRPTTLRDAQKLNLIPSVTTYLRQIAKPALVRYIQNQAIEAALCLTKEEHDLPEKEKVARIRQLADEHASQARDKGVGFHAIVESWMADSTYWPKEEIDDELLTLVIDKLGVRVNPLMTERTVIGQCDGVPYAGKLDAVIKVGLSNLRFSGDKTEPWVKAMVEANAKAGMDTSVLLDLKVRGNITRSYPEDVAQLAAYAKGVENTLHEKVHLVASLLVDSTQFDDGEIKDDGVKLVIWPQHHVEAGWGIFRSAVDLWKYQQLLKAKPWVPDPIDYDEVL